MSDGASDNSVFGIIGDTVGELFNLTLAPLTNLDEVVETTIDHAEGVIDALNPVKHVHDHFGW